MAHNDDLAIPIDPRPPRPKAPEPPPDTLQSVPNANPEATICRTCNRAVMVAHTDADGNCSNCSNCSNRTDTGSMDPDQK